MQVTGIIISIVLIAYMGWMAIFFTAAIVLLGVLWYQYYARQRVKSEGAIFHWFALLGKYQYAELESEFMSIIKEKGLRQGDPFDETIIRARITHAEKETDFEHLLNYVSGIFSSEMHVKKEDLVNEFLTTTAIEPALIIPEVSVLFAKKEGLIILPLHIVISQQGIDKPVVKNGIASEDFIRIFFFLVNPSKEPRQQLRMLSRLIDIIERDNFVNEILKLKNHREIKEYLLHNERYITMQLLPGTLQAEMIGKQLKEVKYPAEFLLPLLNGTAQLLHPTEIPGCSKTTYLPSLENQNLLISFTNNTCRFKSGCFYFINLPHNFKINDESAKTQKTEKTCLSLVDNFCSEHFAGACYAWGLFAHAD
jgi:basic amino acid/polyamine antiporter, APA family